MIRPEDSNRLRCQGAGWREVLLFFYVESSGGGREEREREGDESRRSTKPEMGDRGRAASTSLPSRLSPSGVNDKDDDGRDMTSKRKTLDPRGKT